MQFRSFIARNALSLLFWPFLCLGLYVTSLHSFLLFHTVAETFSIVIAFSLFVIAWNTRHLGASTYVLLIGIASLFIGIVDFVHTLSYKGIGIFSGYDANLPAQLWIGARYMEALSFLGAAWLIDRKPRPGVVFAVYLTATVLLLAAIFSGTMFPDCYVEGWGLTPFKIVSEYVISGILIASLAVLWFRREKFDRQVLGFIALSVAFSIASELAFTFYIDVYGRWNLIGHFLKIFAFYFIYRAIIVTGLENPYRLLFYDLKRQREELETIIDASPSMIIFKDRENRLVRVNRAFAEAVNQPKRDIEGRTSREIFPGQSHDLWEDDQEIILSGLPRKGIMKSLETPAGRK
jgi:PAS domain-containing protein